MQESQTSYGSSTQTNTLLLSFRMSTHMQYNSILLLEIILQITDSLNPRG